MLGTFKELLRNLRWNSQSLSKWRLRAYLDLVLGCPRRTNLLDLFTVPLGKSVPTKVAWRKAKSHELIVIREPSGTTKRETISTYLKVLIALSVMLWGPSFPR